MHLQAGLTGSFDHAARAPQVLPLQLVEAGLKVFE
jgi:hypothetical protein